MICAYVFPLHRGYRTETLFYIIIFWIRYMVNYFEGSVRIRGKMLRMPNLRTDMRLSTFPAKQPKKGGNKSFPALSKPSFQRANCLPPLCDSKMH